MKKLLNCILLTVSVFGFSFNYSAESAQTGFWPLNEGQEKIALDKSGRKNDGTIINCKWEAFDNKNYLYFNGENSYIKIPSDNMKFESKITVEANIKLEKKEGDSADWRKNNQLIAGKSDVFELLISSGDRLSLNLFTDKGLKTVTVFGYPICGKWQKVAFSYDGNNIVLYINDKPIARGEHKGNLIDNKNPLCIGAAARGTYCMFAKGIISEVKIYDSSELEEKDNSFAEVNVYASPYVEELQKSYNKLIRINQTRTLNISYGTPELNGILNDDCWKRAQKKSDFLIASSKPPVFASEKTEVMVCYDKDNLYLGITCKESFPEKIKSSITDHDSTIWMDDCIEIFLGKKPLKTYYHFFVNPHGTKSDIETVFLEENYKGIRYKNNKDWNPEWQAVTSKNADSWTTEIAIPWAVLPDMKADANSYINICREEKPHSENSTLGYLSTENFNDIKGFISFSTDLNGNSVEKDFTALLKKIKDLEENNKNFYTSLKQHSYSFPYAFDFGTASSPLKKGFTRITKDSLYQKQKRYGFKKTDGLSCDTMKINDWGPDELSCDFVEGKEDNEFIIDMPDGDYIFHFIAGDNKVPPPFSIYVNNEKVADATDGVNIYRLKQFPVSVKNGSVNIGFKGKNGWLINGLIAYPKKDDFVFIKEIERLEDDIYLGPNPEYIAKFTRYDYMEKNSLPAADKETEERGFFIVPENNLNIIYEKSIPSFKNVFPKCINMSAAKGEYEETAFSILPLKNLEDFKVEYTDFTGKNGKIEKSLIQLRELKHYYHNFAGFRPARYMKFPKVLEKYSTHNLYADKTYTFRLTVKVPENAKPGDYYSTVTLQTAGNKTMDFQLELTVYPFSLDPCNDYTFAMCYHLPEQNLKRGINGWDTLLLELRDMKEHNMNSVNFRPLKKNQWPELGIPSKSIDTEGFAQLFRYASKADLTNDIPLCIELYLPYYLEKNKIDFKEEEWKYVKDALLELQKICNKEKLPGFYFYLDEPWMPERAYNYGNVFKFLKTNGLKIFCTIGQKPVYFPLFPLLDVRCYGYRDGKVPEILEQTSKDKSQFWVYNGPTWNYIPAKSRFTIGYKTWWEGAKGHMVWNYSIFWGGGMPLNPLSNSNGVHAHEIISDLTGPVATTTWEAIRKGIDDIKYIRTLEKLIASKKETPTAIQAQKFLDDLKTEIGKASDKEWNNFADGEPLSDKISPLSNSYFDETKKKIAEYIIKLSN